MKKFAIAASAALAAAAPAADLVTSLPGFGAPLTKMYSGYLNITSSTGNKHMHYVFYESMGNPSTDPVQLWLNGGPGCSSMEGSFQEIGPLWTAPGGNGLQLNNYTSNKFVNLMFLEAPACVGFSYADDPNAGCAADDESQAVDNLAAMIQFYKEFPEFAKNPFWITGESYAGIYIPTLAAAIYASNMAGKSNIPLTGIMVGNGCIGSEVGICGNAIYGDYLSIKQLYGHGFVSDVNWNAMLAACGNFSVDSPACDNAINAAGNDPGNNLNVYDLYDSTWGVCNYGGLVSPKRKTTIRPRRPVRAGSLAARLSATANACTTDADLVNYMNLPAVQAALHVQPTAWDTCANIDYTRNLPDERTTIYPTLLEQAKIRVVIYNGEADACVPITDNQWWTDSLATARGYPTTTPWTAWTATDGSTGGYVTTYGNVDFTFISIRGAGHMVPQTQPPYAFDLFNRGINNLPWGN